MSEPVVTVELSRDPIPPDPAAEYIHKVQALRARVEDLEEEADYWRKAHDKAEWNLHNVVAERTKAVEELARLIGH